MTEIDLAYFNYEHGGMVGHSDRGDGGGAYFYDGLVNVMGENDRWPDLFVMGEGDRYEFSGGLGAWGACAAMSQAGGRHYAWLACHLPRDWGPFAPVIFYDPQTVQVYRFYSRHAPDFAARNRNILIARPRAGGVLFQIAAIHGDFLDQSMRTHDAAMLRWFGNDTMSSAILGDWNEPLSGPRHEPTDLDNEVAYPPAKMWHSVSKIQMQHGRPTTPVRASTGAPDYLCGYWDEEVGARVGGVGMHSAAELAQVYTGTNMPKTSGRQATQIDHILVNGPMARRIVPGSFAIHEPINPNDPDSDHKRVSVTVTL